MSDVKREKRLQRRLNRKQKKLRRQAESIEVESEPMAIKPLPKIANDPYINPPDPLDSRPLSPKRRRRNAVNEVARALDAKLTWGSGFFGRVAEWLDGKIIGLALNFIVERVAGWLGKRFDD